jgi:hypothetical protein
VPVDFGSEPWPLAIVLGAVVVILSLLPLRISRSFDRHTRRYFEVRSALLALVGLGIALGHWHPSAGSTIIVLAVLGLLVTMILRRSLLS